jgi:hypothetical protein
VTESEKSELLLRAGGYTHHEEFCEQVLDPRDLPILAKAVVSLLRENERLAARLGELESVAESQRRQIVVLTAAIEDEIKDNRADGNEQNAQYLERRIAESLPAEDIEHG